MDVTALLDRLASGDERALGVLQDASAEVLPALRAARRTGPRRLRRSAMRALAAVGGPQALDDTDLAVIRRLIRIKIPTEIPQPMHLCGSWYSVPTDDHAAVLDAFDLSDAEPVTMRLGAQAWTHDQHWFGATKHRRCARVYISPALDGWTLVFGQPSQDLHRLDAFPDIGGAPDPTASALFRTIPRERCSALSRRFGAAHYYGMSCGDSWTSWCIAEDGDLLRHYDAHEPTDQIGPPHSAEVGFLLPHEDPFPDDAFDGIDYGDLEHWEEQFRARYAQVKAELGIPDHCYATDIAARISVNPDKLGPNTRVRGHGLLALTSCGREHGHPRGAVPI